MKMNIYFTTSLHLYLSGVEKTSLLRKFNDPEYDVYMKKPETTIGNKYWDPSDYIYVLTPFFWRWI